MKAVRPPAQSDEVIVPSTRESFRPLEHAKSALLQEDRELILSRIQDIIESIDGRAATREKAHQIETGALHERIIELRGELDEKDQQIRDQADELEDFKRRSRRDDQDRDDRIDKVKKLAEDVAEQVIKITKPQLEANGAVGAKVVTDESSKETKRWAAIASFVGVTIATAISTGFAQCRQPTPESGVSIPNTKPKPAGTGFAGIP